MKKSLIAVMILAITTTALIGCGKKDNSSKNDNSKPIVAGEDTSTNDNKENSTVVEAEEEEKADESTSSSNAETSATNTYSEAEMEEIEAITTEQIEEYARELGQKYYDYEIDLNVMKKIDGINLYYFAVHSGPPNNTVKKYMLGADGVLYNYQSAINGILQMEQ